MKPRSTIVALLALSATAIALAPLAMPEGYSWVSNAISESAAQAQQGAWVARIGFLLFGFAVLWLTRQRREAWGTWGVVFFGAFGVFMISTAAFSHRPWQTGVPFDEFEDLLHSVTASGMGLAFAAGVVAVTLRRGSGAMRARAFDVVAVLASVVLPMGMANWASVGGLLQRLLFLIAYVWYAVEALRSEPAL